MNGLAPTLDVFEGGPEAGAHASDLHWIELLLRDRDAFLSALRNEDAATLARMARLMLYTIAVSAGILGVCLGLARGGWQPVLSAVKLPAVVLLTAGICAPLFTALNLSLGYRADFRRDLVLVLSSLALGCGVAATLSPVIVMAVLYSDSYRLIILAALFCGTIGGAAGLAHFRRGLGDKHAVAIILLSVVALVGAHMTWSMRPYVGVPTQSAPPVLRLHSDDAFDGSFLDSLNWTMGGEFHGYQGSP